MNLKEIAVKLDIVFVVRMQMMWLSVREAFGKGGQFGGVIGEILQEVEGRTWLDYKDTHKAKGKDSRVYVGVVQIRSTNIHLSINTPRVLREEEVFIEGDLAAGVNEAVRRGDVGINNRGVDVAIGSHNTTAVSVVQGILKNLIFDNLLKLDSANITLDHVVLRHQFIGGGSDLVALLMPLYRNSLTKNLPSLFGAMNVFGNPLGLIKGIGDGATDFVNENLEGIKRSVEEVDPTYAFKGIYKGSQSLGKGVVGGLAQSAGSITSTIGSNLSALTLDSKFKSKRQEYYQGEAPGSLLESLGSGGSKVFEGVVEGVGGVVLQPIRGAERHGMKGFGTGVVRGITGLVFKPFVGVADGLSEILKGIEAGVGYHDVGDFGELAVNGKGTVKPCRPRRAIYGTERVVKAYNGDDAAGSKLLSRTSLGRSACFEGLFCFEGLYVLLSSKGLVFVNGQGEEMEKALFSDVRSSRVDTREETNGDVSFSGSSLVLEMNEASAADKVIYLGEIPKGEYDRVSLLLAMIHDRAVVIS